MQRLLTANLTQGVNHEKEGCMLMPVPGAHSYALSNLEHAVVDGLTPAWFRDVQDAFYYSGLTGGWLIIIVAIWLLWQCMQVHRRPIAAPVPATNVFTTVPPPTPRYCKPSFPIVSKTSFASVPLAIEDHRVDTQPLRVAGVEDGFKAKPPKVISHGYPVLFRH